MAPLAVFVAKAEVQSRRIARVLEGVGEGLLEAASIIRVHELEQLATAVFIDSIAEDLFDRGALVADFSLRIQNSDHVERIFCEAAEVSFAFLESFAGVLAFNHATE